MSTYFTIWHYGVVILCIVLFLITIIISIKEPRVKIRNSMIFSSFLVLVLVAAFLIMALDKYTKIAKVTGVKNRRMLNTEEIVYSGYVQNVGNYTIGEVRYEIKLVNRGHETGKVKGGSFYKPSGFFDFIGGGDNKKANRPQKYIHTFVIAKKLKPGETRFFSVSMPYPPYFKHVADFKRTFAH